METAPSTKLKGDLLLELRDIRLEINKENSKLAEVRRARIEAEDNFNAREKSLSEREEPLRRLEEKFNSVAGDAELYHEQLKEKVAKLLKHVQTLLKDKGKLDEIIENVRQRKDKKVKEFTDLIAGKKEYIAELDRQIEDKKGQIVGLDTDIGAKTSELQGVRDELTKALPVLDTKKKENEDESARLERIKSELRVWSVRLHRRYGKFMTEPENIIIGKDI